MLSRADALAAGMTPRAIGRRVRSGKWRALHPGVYAPRPVPPSWLQRLIAAVLSGGPSALASHRAAGALWGLDGLDEGPVEISIQAGRQVRGAIVHRRRSSDNPATVVIAGIRTTSIERTLLDLAGVVPTARTALALDDALRRRLTSVRRLRAHVASVAPRGRVGSGTLRSLLDARDHRDELAESRLEGALLHLLRKRGVELPTPQFVVVDGGAMVGRLDFAYPERKIAIEADGYRWHATPERWKRDLRRDTHLRLLGWTVLRFSWDDVHDRPETVADQVRRALDGTASRGSLGG